MDGTILQGIMKENGFSGPILAKAAKLSEGSIYRYYSLETIKKNTLEKLLKSVGLTLTDWQNYREGLHTNEQNNLVAEEAGPYGRQNKIIYHQGLNLETIRKQKGVSITALSNRLNISRRGYYNYIKEKELPTGVLLEAAQALSIPVAAIKGIGQTEKSFEKDVYMTLMEIKWRLEKIEKYLQKGRGNL